MSKRSLCCTLAIWYLAVTVAAVPASAQVCGPDENGRLADVSYGSTTIQWDPVVEYREMVLTIGGPCEDIVKVFGPKETIFFDLREIERVTDGQYTWQLRRVAKVDEGVQKELEASRGSGKEDQVWWSFWQQGAIPAGPFVDSASFAVVKGEIIGPDGRVEEKSASLASKGSGGGAAAAIQSALPGALAGTAASEQGGNVLASKATVLTNADGVIRNSLCVGFDCPNNPTFSDTTILMMENNTRIKFDDTSTITGFPRNDWEIEANSSLSGGASYLGFNDCGNSSQGGCATDLVFAVEAGVRQNALYVESDGDVGFGTSNPVLRLHVTKGDSPGLRLEQDGSSGFAPQTWDVVGNETNFFVRDATGGSTLPFRIRPGAPSNSIHIAAGGNVGMGTASPGARLEVRSTAAGAASVRYTNTSATGFTGGEYFEDTTQGLFVGLDNANNLARINAVNNYPLVILTNSSERIRFPAPGGNFITAANGASLTAGGMWADASSRELKRDIIELDAAEALSAVAGLTPVKFEYKSEPGEQYVGFIAEEVPELVARNDQKTLTPMDIVAVLTKVVQKQQTTIEELTERLEELEKQEK